MCVVISWAGRGAKGSPSSNNDKHMSNHNSVNNNKSRIYDTNSSVYIYIYGERERDR